MSNYTANECNSYNSIDQNSIRPSDKQYGRKDQSKNPFYNPIPQQKADDPWGWGWDEGSSSPSDEWIEINSKDENKNEKPTKKSELNNNLNPTPLHLPNQNFYTNDSSSNFESHFQNNLPTTQFSQKEEELKQVTEEENREIIPPEPDVCLPSYYKERVVNSAAFPRVAQVDSKLDNEVETVSTNISNLQLHSKPQTDFINREEYFENTHLGENMEDISPICNEIIDDEPLPPPGLRRLVTGQTVSFDESPASPAFDRYVPGQGDGISNAINQFSNYTGNHKERLVTGGVADQTFFIQQFPPVFQPSSMQNHTEYMKHDGSHKQDSAVVENKETRNFTDVETTWKPSSSTVSSTVHRTEVLTNIGTQESSDQDNYPMLFQHEFVRSSSLESEVGSSITDPSRNILDLSQEVELEPRMELEGAITPQTSVATQPNRIFQTVKNPFPVDKNQRMAIEGAPERMIYKPPMLTPDDSPAYDQWYQSQPRPNESYIPQEDERKKKLKIANELHGHDAQRIADSGSKPLVKSLEIPKNILERPKQNSTPNLPPQDKDHRTELVRNRTEGINLQDFEQLDDSSSSDFNQEYNNGFKNSTVMETPIQHEIPDRSIGSHKLHQPKMKEPAPPRQESHANPIGYGHPNQSKPRERKTSKQHSKDQVYDRNHSPPRELRRMVVGETASSSSGMRPSIDDEGLEQEYINEEIPARNNSVFMRSNKETLNSTHSDRRRRKVDSESKHRYRRDREIESDNEEYEDSVRHYDGSPDRESRGYRARNARYTRKMRKDHERDSFAYSQDESYYDDDDYYDSSRELSRYQSRRQYDRYADRRYYGPNDSYREDPRHYRDHRDDYFKAPHTRQYQEPYHGKKGRPHKEEIQDDRPSSRSGSEYRRGPRDYPYTRSYGKGSYYMDHEHQYATVPGRTIVDLDGRLINFKDLLEFRSRDPEGYAIWYNSYTIARKRGGEAHSISSNYQPDRRGSGHSGQSSGEDEPIGKSDEKFDIQDKSTKYQEEQTVAEIRSSPVKFSIAHVKGSFNKLGQLIIVNPNVPTDGQSAVVEIANITPPQDQDLIEFLNFPGPFIVGETHVNTVSEYLKHYAAFSSNRSEKLLYQLIDLIIRLRGVTDGIAISELLMEDYRTNSDQDCLISPDESSIGFDNNQNQLTTAEVSEKYMRLLLQGNKIAALECAINNQEWGHAFLLASKMDMKYYSIVLARFDSTINNNSPLKTLYQFMSGQIPQAAMRCGDDKWGDWRPHLAMILSNPTGNEELNRRAIIALGDSLGAQKDVYSSHFCYLTAQIEFEPVGKYGSKYTLLGIRNSDLLDRKPEFVSSRAMLLTQAYEFAKRLQRREFCIRTLMPFKYLLTTRLMEYGKNDAATTYLEAIASDILADPSSYNMDLIKLVLDASEKVTYANRKPIYANDVDNREKWLIDLKGILSNGLGARIASPELLPQPQPQLQQPEPEIPKWENEPNIQDTRHNIQDNVQISQIPQMYIPPHNEYQPEIYQPQQQEPQTYESHNWDNSPVIDVVPDQRFVPQNVEYENNNYEFNNPRNNTNNDNVEINDENGYYQPNWNNAKKITISSQAKANYFNVDDDISNSQKPMGNSSIKADQKPTKEKSENKEKKMEHGENNNSGWLGGIFGKLALRPKNQMKLPDDKNPTIVWNEEQKRWINVNNDEKDACDNVAPPPKALPKFPSNDQSKQPQSLPPPGFQNNQQPQSLPQNGFLPPANQFQSQQPQSLPTTGYKISRSKGMKSNYVNVLGNSISTSSSQPPSLDTFPTHQESMEYYMPPQGDNVGGNADYANNSNAPLANIGPQEGKIGEVPMFYNPAQYNNMI